MGKSRYYRYEIPTSVVQLVKSICIDYDRREKAIKYSSITGPVLDKYVFLNAAVDSALDEIEPGIRKSMFDDILNNTGYNFSQSSIYLARNTYYQRKRKVIYEIAKNLALI